MVVIDRQTDGQKDRQTDKVYYRGALLQKIENLTRKSKTMKIETNIATK